MRGHWLFCAAAALLACGAPAGAENEAFDDQQVVEDFADQVVIPTYALLAERTDALSAAVDSLGEDTTQKKLAAAREAWLGARVPWEQSEGFLFGPVDTFGYDPAIDSWPVNHTDLDAVLASGAAFTPEFVGNLQETQKGFHTLEYLLFGIDGARVAAELTRRELEYMSAIARELSDTAQALAASWTNREQGRASYRDLFATAGQPGNTAYPSRSAAVQEILGGMIGICDEVANGKLADPYSAHDPTLVESQFALNSLADFQDNLRSVQNAYSGSVPAAGTRGRGLSAHVAELEPELDERVRSEIEAAIRAIGAIPGPFRDAITTPSSYDEIEAAQQAVRELQATLEQAILPLILR